MLADEVPLERLVGGGGEERGLGQQLDLQRQQVAEDARQRDDTSTRGRPSSSSGISVGAGEAAVAVEARPARRSAPAPGAIGPPSVFRLSVPHSTSAIDSGKAWPSARWRCEQPLGLARAVLRPRRRSGCGTDRSRAGCGRSAGSPACAADRRRAPGARSGRRARAGAPAISWSSASSASVAASSRSSVSVPASAAHAAGGQRRLRRLRRATSASTASRVGPRAVRGLGDRQQHVDALARRGRLADDMQAVRDQRVLEFEHGVAERGDLRCRRRRPRRARPRASSSAAACAWISAASSARSAAASGARPRQRSSERLQIDQAAIQAGVRDRRRQVADQRRGGAALGDRALATDCWRRRDRSSAGRRSAGRASTSPDRPACLPGMNSSAPCVPKCSTACAPKSSRSQR